MAETSSPENLFKEFEKPDKAEWIKKVLTDMKGKPFESLRWKSSENIEIQPFYTPEDTENLDYTQSFQHCFANFENPAYGPRHWTNYEFVHVTGGAGANKAALNALEMGADGILFNLDQTAELPAPDVLLDKVLCDHCHLSFHSSKNIVAFVEDYINYLEKNGNNPQNINGFYGRDALAAWTTGYEEPGNNYFKELANLFEKTATYPNFKPLTVSSYALEHSGASVVQELALTINMAVDYFDRLTDQGLSPDRVIQGTVFSLSVGSDFFMEIAKFRAFRILFHEVAKGYGLSRFHAGDIKIHGTSGYWNKTLSDLNNNMLRNTTEAMAAIIGGCDSIQITPHDDTQKSTKASSRRIARNISSMLKDEAYLDKVVDPVAGSYYVENLTHELVKGAWALFKEVENQGGFMNSFKTNKIQEAIAATRTKKFSQIASRRSVIVGVNQYPDKNEKLAPLTRNGAEKNTDEAREYDPLTPHRGSEQFEALKMKTQHFAAQHLNGKKPQVLLAILGRSAMQKARVDFIDTFFACGGFEAVTSSNDSDVNKGVEEAVGAEEKVVIICGSNEDYEEKAMDFVKQFRASEPDKMLWLAGMPPGPSEAFLEAGLHGFIHIKSNVIDTISQIQHFLGIDKGKEILL